MGLLTKEVEVGLNNVTIKHYESLGNEIPRIKNRNGKWVTPRGTKIMVKVEDLKDGSHAKVDIKCDGCKKILKHEWRRYKTQKKEDDTYFCHKCVNNGCKKFISFEEWCINNNHEDYLNRFDLELNDCKPFEISFATNKKYYFKCPRCLHESELKKVSTFTRPERKNAYERCEKCRSFAQVAIDRIGKDFLEKYWDFEKNVVNPWEITFGNSFTSIYIKCLEKDYHDSYNTTPASFLDGNRCPYCRMLKVHELDSLGALFPDALLMWSDKNLKDAYKYAPFAGDEVWWKCHNSKHEDYLRKIGASNIYDFRCPECHYSKGENKIEEWLNDKFLKISQKDFDNLDNFTLWENEYYLSQIKFDGLVGLGGRKLSYDFYLPQYNLLIEYQGEYHDGTAGNQTEKDFEKQKEHDKRKKKYAKNNNIKLLEIWYWNYDNIDKILDECFK